MRNQTVIRRLIREMLNEVMRTPIDSKMPNMRVDVNFNRQDEITISLTNRDPETKTNVPNGQLVAGKIRGKPEAPCKSATRPDLTGRPWQIKWANATPGWGPFLYHLMLQVIEERDPKSSGLMADRDEVSPDALGVWKKFNAGIDTNIEFEQMDDELNTITPDIESDNCSQRSLTYSRMLGRDEESEEQNYDAAERKQWLENSPITKVYRRKPGARDWRGELIDLGIYYENGVQLSPWDAD